MSTFCQQYLAMASAGDRSLRENGVIHSWSMWSFRRSFIASVEDPKSLGCFALNHHMTSTYANSRESPQPLRCRHSPGAQGQAYRGHVALLCMDHSKLESYEHVEQLFIIPFDKERSSTKYRVLGADRTPRYADMVNKLCTQARSYYM